MSHVKEQATLIKDVEALGTAVKTFGGTLEPASTYRWFGRSVGDYPLPKGRSKAELGKCDYAISLPGTRYQVGVCRQENGTFSLAYDFYGSETGNWDGQNERFHDGQKLLKKFGKDLCQLQVAYNRALVVKQAKSHGFLVREQKTSVPGQVRLQLIKV